jgi:hypothetical protein
MCGGVVDVDDDNNNNSKFFVKYVIYGLPSDICIHYILIMCVCVCVCVCVHSPVDFNKVNI